MPRERADGERAAFELDPAKPFEGAQIDQCGGLASLILSAGTSDWPPASGFGISTLRSSDTASFMLLGR